MVAAIFSNFRCWAWLKWVSGVARGARMVRLSWHGLQTAADGNRLSETDVLVVTEA